MNSKLTLYEEWRNLESEIEKMRFFFKNSMGYKNCKIRYSIKQNGFYITDSIKRKYFAEYSKVSSEFIHLYSVKSGKIKECCKEIILDNFVKNMKKTDELLKL